MQKGTRAGCGGSELPPRALEVPENPAPGRPSVAPGKGFPHEDRRPPTGCPSQESHPRGAQALSPTPAPGLMAPPTPALTPAPGLMDSFTPGTQQIEPWLGTSGRRKGQRGSAGPVSGDLTARAPALLVQPASPHPEHTLLHPEGFALPCWGPLRVPGKEGSRPLLPAPFLISNKTSRPAPTPPDDTWRAPLWEFASGAHLGQGCLPPCPSRGAEWRARGCRGTQGAPRDRCFSSHKGAGQVFGTRKGIPRAQRGYQRLEDQLGT